VGKRQRTAALQGGRDARATSERRGKGRGASRLVAAAGMPPLLLRFRVSSVTPFSYIIPLLRRRASAGWRKCGGVPRTWLNVRFLPGGSPVVHRDFTGVSPG
jgi:hypothetical protein